jgi:hypothetical protein
VLFWYVPTNSSDYDAAMGVVRDHTTDAVDAVIMMCQLQVAANGSVVIGAKGGHV